MGTCEYLLLLQSSWLLGLAIYHGEIGKICHGL